MTSQIHIRPARPDDAPLAAAIFRLTMEGLADYLFGADGRQTEIALMRLFSDNAGRLGYGVSFVVESRRALGMLTAFPGADVPRLSLAVAPHLPRALGWRLFDFAARSLRLAGIREAGADEYLISNLGVLPAAQGHGLGTRLLLHAEDQARRHGLSKCSLLVSAENQIALRLYQKHGYRSAAVYRRSNPPVHYFRMVKELPLTTNHKSLILGGNA